MCAGVCVIVSAHVYVWMYCPVLRKASSPAAVPPYISRMVRGCFEIVYRDKGLSVGLEGGCICSEDFGVGYSRNGLL